MPDPTIPVADTGDKTHSSRFLTGKQALGKTVYEAGCDRVEKVYDRFDQVAVLFSGGKDSTATLHCAIDVATALGKLPVRAIFFDEEAIPYETEAYVRRVSERDDVNLEWYCAPVTSNNACAPQHPFWWPWEPESEDLWVRPYPPEGKPIPGFPLEPRDQRPKHAEANTYLVDPAKGTTCLLLGIRAAESMIRNNAVRRRAEDGWLIQSSDGPFYKGYPIYDWTTADVWTAPATMGWDYNEAYDLLAMAGLTPDQQRCAPPFGAEPMQALWTFKTCFPDLWDRMVDRVPGAAAAARYSRTELYSFGVVPPKPDDTTWPQHVRALVGQHAEETQGKVAAQLSAAIAKHFRKTTEPILVDTPHPDTGVSWKYLATIAHRGDPWGRRISSFRLAFGDNYARIRARYDRELDAMTKADRLDSIDPRKPVQETV